jgi:type I restriction enzyme S subunit
MIPSDFRTVTFQELINEGVLEIGDGYRAKNEELGGTGPLFLRAGHVTDTHIDFEGVERFHVSLTDKLKPKMTRVGDTIVTTKGNSTGRTSYVTPEMPAFVYSPHLSYWRSRDEAKVASGFLRYWSRSSEFTRQLSGMKASTDMAPYLSLTDQRRLRITLLPGDEQQAIACILGALDDKIELNRRRNRTLEAMARAIFQSWFVDFDPVKAKAAGHKPAGLSKEIAALFPTSFEDSDLGEIPQGWSAETLGAIAANFSRTFDFSKCEEPVFINTGDVLDGDFLHRNRNAKTELPGQAKKAIITDDILFTEIRPANRRFAYIDFDAANHVVSTKFMVIRTLGKINQRFLYRILTRDETLNIFQAEAESRSGTFPQITFDSVSYLPLVLAPKAIQDAFQELIDPLETKIKVIKEECRTLAALRDTLLPKLISGELRVPDAERIVRRAV